MGPAQNLWPMIPLLEFQTHSSHHFPSSRVIFTCSKWKWDTTIWSWLHVMFFTFILFNFFPRWRLDHNKPYACNFQIISWDILHRTLLIMATHKSWTALKKGVQWWESILSFLQCHVVYQWEQVHRMVVAWREFLVWPLTLVLSSSGKYKSNIRLQRKVEKWYTSTMYLPCEEGRKN